MKIMHVAVNLHNFPSHQSMKSIIKHDMLYFQGMGDLLKQLDPTHLHV